MSLEQINSFKGYLNCSWKNEGGWNPYYCDQWKTTAQQVFLWLNSSADWENSGCKLKTYLANHKLLLAGLKEINFPLGEEGWAEGQEYLFLQTHNKFQVL